MTTEILTYSTIWKQMMTYLFSKSKGAVYYTYIGGHYTPYLVDLNQNVIYSTAYLQNADLTDFVNNVKPTAILINVAGDAVALAVMSAGA